MNISPLDIQQQQFKGRIFGGLDPEDVDVFLQMVSREMEQLVRENNDLKDQNRKMLSELEDMNSREKALRETMLAAQRISEDMKNNAQKEASIIISDAELKSEKLLASAEGQLSSLRNEIQELRRQKQLFQASFRSLLENYMKLLSAAND